MKVYTVKYEVKDYTLAVGPGKRLEHYVTRSIPFLDRESAKRVIANLKKGSVKNVRMEVER